MRSIRVRTAHRRSRKIGRVVPAAYVPPRTAVKCEQIIAITGSAGKSTTKEMIASILRRQWCIYKSQGNLNYLGNTRKHVRRLQPQHRAAVLEFGMLRSGDIEKHCSIIQPTIGVITNIGSAHIGNVGSSPDGLAMAKSELIRNMDPTGIVFLNADCPFSSQFSSQPYRGEFSGRFYTVGMRRPADYMADNIRYEEGGMRFECELNGVPRSFLIPVFGEHNIYNALLAIAVADVLQFPPDVIQEGLRTFQRLQRRLTIHQRNGIRVIDDTYSANPHAMKAAVHVLNEVGTGTNIAVFGSMMELGEYTAEGHAEVGKYLANKKVDYLYTMGPKARHIGTAAIESGFPKQRVVHCANRKQLHRLLAKQIKPDTTVLVKGSHKMRMDQTGRFLRMLAARTSTGEGSRRPQGKAGP